MHSGSLLVCCCSFWFPLPFALFLTTPFTRSLHQTDHHMFGTTDHLPSHPCNVRDRISQSDRGGWGWGVRERRAGVKRNGGKG